MDAGLLGLAKAPPGNQNDRMIQSSAFHSIQSWCGFDAVARAVASNVVCIGDLSGGARGALRVCVSHYYLFRNLLPVAC